VLIAAFGWTRADPVITLQLPELLPQPRGVHRRRAVEHVTPRVGGHRAQHDVDPDIAPDPGEVVHDGGAPVQHRAVRPQGAVVREGPEDDLRQPGFEGVGVFARSNPHAYDDEAQPARLGIDQHQQRHLVGAEPHPAPRVLDGKRGIGVRERDPPRGTDRPRRAERGQQRDKHEDRKPDQTHASLPPVGASTVHGIMPRGRGEEAMRTPGGGRDRSGAGLSFLNESIPEGIGSSAVYGVAPFVRVECGKGLRRPGA